MCIIGDLPTVRAFTFMTYSFNVFFCLVYSFKLIILDTDVCRYILHSRKGIFVLRSAVYVTISPHPDSSVPTVDILTD